MATTVKNTGDENLKLLNDPSSSLSTMPADTFKITGGSSDVVPTFIGVKVKYVPKTAIANEAYTVLAPNESVTVYHDCKCISTLMRSR